MNAARGEAVRAAALQGGEKKAEGENRPSWSTGWGHGRPPTSAGDVRVRENGLDCSVRSRLWIRPWWSSEEAANRYCIVR